MGGTVSSGVDNDDLVDNLVEAGYVKTPSVEAVLRVVDRGMYYLPENRSLAYRDSAWKEGLLHLSAPCIYAEALEALKLEPGNAFLNVGSGTGYLSTIAGLLVGAYGINHGLELHQSNVKYAYDRLQTFYRESPALRYFDFSPPAFVVGNALKLGDEFLNRYDRIYVGAGCDSSSVNQFAKYLKVGGSMVVPSDDNLVRLTKGKEGKFTEERLMQVSFAHLILPVDDAAPLQLPKSDFISLKHACRTVIVRSLRSRIFTEYPDIKMPRVHPKPPTNRRGQRHVRRMIYPFFVAENGADGPHVVIGDPVHLNQDDDDDNEAQDGAADVNAQVPPADPDHLEEVDEAADPTEMEDDSEADQDISDHDDFQSANGSGDEKLMHENNDSLTASDDEESTIRIKVSTFQVRSGTAALAAIRTSNAATGDGPSTSMQSVQQEIQALGSALNQLRESVDPPTISSASSANATIQESSAAAAAALPPPVAPPALPTNRVTRAIMRRLHEKKEPSTAGRPAPESESDSSNSAPASERMEIYMVDAVHSLPVPRLFKRFLNFDRPLEAPSTDLT